MTKRKFIGLGRNRRAGKVNRKPLELPDNFIFGTTNQHKKPDTKETIDRVDSPE